MGVDCFRQISGERIPVNVRYYDGSNPEAMHNYYTYLYNKCMFELFERGKGVGNALLFARSATWDPRSSHSLGAETALATYPSMAENGGLSFAMSGFSFWSQDISGFESTATPDLYKS